MNKKLLLSLLAAASMYGAAAQKLKEGSLDFLNNQTELNIVFDYTHLKIEGKSEEYYAIKEGKEWQKDWNNSKKEFFEKFVNSMNLELINRENKLRCGSYGDAKYQATIWVLELDDDNDMNAEVIIHKISDNQALARITLYGAAGAFGTMANLVGDAMKDAGKKLGKFLAKKLK